jgi:7-carboxy-7-deazaguanine synthase
MHGLNPIANPRTAQEGFILNSLWFTLQGEGPFVGKPAIFVRLSGCNLRCTWCDTAFEQGTYKRPIELIRAIKELSAKYNCNFIVITGGEPMLQPLHLIIDDEDLSHCFFQIETAGSYWPYAGLTSADIPPGVSTGWLPNVSIVVSPKTPMVVRNLRHCHLYDVYWKYIVRAKEAVDPLDGLPNFSTQSEGREMKLFRPINAAAFRDRIFIQPCDEGDDTANKANTCYARDIAMQYGYRLSLQTHKMLDIE